MQKNHSDKELDDMSKTLGINTHAKIVPLYQLQRGEGIKIRGIEKMSYEKNGDTVDVLNPVVVFGHIDGMYSYCWLDGEPDVVIHLNAGTPLIKEEDGYRIYKGEQA